MMIQPACFRRTRSCSTRSSHIRYGQVVVAAAGSCSLCILQLSTAHSQLWRLFTNMLVLNGRGFELMSRPMFGRSYTGTRITAHKRTFTAQRHHLHTHTHRASEPLLPLHLLIPPRDRRISWETRGIRVVPRGRDACRRCVWFGIGHTGAGPGTHGEYHLLVVAAESSVYCLVLLWYSVSRMTWSCAVTVFWLSVCSFSCDLPTTTCSFYPSFRPCTYRSRSSSLSS